jgi:hypothetical protein
LSLRERARDMSSIRPLARSVPARCTSPDLLQLSAQTTPQSAASYPRRSRRKTRGRIFRPLFAKTVS